MTTYRISCERSVIDGYDYVAYHENRAYPLVISALTHSRFLNTCSTRVPFSPRRSLLLTLFSPYPPSPFSFNFPSLRRFFSHQRTIHHSSTKKPHFRDSLLIFHARSIPNRRSHRSGKRKFFSNRIRSG